MSAGGHGRANGGTKGIVIVVVVGRRCRTKTRDIPKQIRQTRRNQGRRGARRQERKGQPDHRPNTSPTTMAQGTSKLAEKSKKANKKTQNMKKGKKFIPPKKAVAIKQRQATKVRPRRGDEVRYSHTTAEPFGKDHTFNRTAGSSRSLQWKTYDHEAHRFELKELTSTRTLLTTVICIQDNGPRTPLQRLLLHTEASITEEPDQTFTASPAPSFHFLFFFDGPASSSSSPCSA